jgi:hypothetical protein
VQFAINTDEGLVFEEQNGRFFHRRFVTHEYRAVQAILARRVAEDVENFARANRHLTSSPEEIASLELSEVYDPYEGFHDPDDFPPVWQ